LQTIVKKWLRGKNYGFLENGSGPDIMVRKEDLIKCQYLKVGATVEFECHLDNRNLIARKVKLARQNIARQKPNSNRGTKKHYFGVMT